MAALLCLVLAAGCEQGILSLGGDPASAADASTRDGAADDQRAGDAAGAERRPPTDGGGATTGYSCSNPGPSWLFCEDFEAMGDGFDSWFAGSGWTGAIGADNPGRMTSSTAAHRGSYAVHYPAAASAGYQGAELTWRPCVGENRPGCSLQGYPQLYFRVYVRFAPDHRQVHHFLSVGGGPLNDYWAPFGTAGCRPNGRRSMGTTVDFRAGSHESHFYTYFPRMGCDPGDVCNRYADAQRICDGCATKDMPCLDGLECCWGNHFTPDQPVPLPLDRWFCFELMMRANDVGQANGEMAYWIDGQLALRVQEMEFRTDNNLQLNMAGLQHYLTTEGADGHSNQVWFDDVVVSTERVGCD